MVEEREPVARPRIFFAGALLAAVFVVAISRAILLARGADVLTSISERRFLGRTYGDAALNAALAGMAPLLRDGEAVCLRSQPHRYEPRWLRVMGTYALPRQVVVVPDASRSSAPLCGRTSLIVRADGSIVLVRAPRVALY